MPFVESSQSLRSKLHLTQVSTPVLLGILVLCVLAGVLAVQNIVTAASEPVFAVQSNSSTAAESGAGESSDAVSGQAESASADAAATVVVFVSGCVAAPGVYELPEGSRVGEAVDAAGGFTEEAATDAVNLARVLSDGEQIAIVSRESLEAPGAAADDSGSSGQASSATAPQSTGATGLVNINTADEAALETLPGIGPSTAQKIVADREAEGPFASKEDIKRVSGIGDKKYEAIADLITV